MKNRSPQRSSVFWTVSIGTVLSGRIECNFRFTYAHAYVYIVSCIATITISEASHVMIELHDAVPCIYLLYLPLSTRIAITVVADIARISTRYISVSAIPPRTLRPVHRCNRNKVHRQRINRRARVKLIFVTWHPQGGGPCDRDANTSLGVQSNASGSVRRAWALIRLIRTRTARVLSAVYQSDVLVSRWRIRCARFDSQRRTWCTGVARVLAGVLWSDRTQYLGARLQDTAGLTSSAAFTSTADRCRTPRGRRSSSWPIAAPDRATYRAYCRSAMDASPRSSAGKNRADLPRMRAQEIKPFRDLG